MLQSKAGDQYPWNRGNHKKIRRKQAGSTGIGAGISFFLFYYPVKERNKENERQNIFY